jgi:hypothetical protein
MFSFNASCPVPYHRPPQSCMHEVCTGRNESCDGYHDVIALASSLGLGEVVSDSGSEVAAIVGVQDVDIVALVNDHVD